MDLYDTTSLTDVKINKTVCESGLAWPDIEIEENSTNKVKELILLLEWCGFRLNPRNPRKFLCLK